MLLFFVLMHISAWYKKNRQFCISINIFSLIGNFNLLYLFVSLSSGNFVKDKKNGSLPHKF